MKSKFILSFAFFALIFSYSSMLKAQIGMPDSLTCFQQPLELETGGQYILGDSGFGYKLQTQSVMKTATISYSKKQVIPRAARVTDKPIILEGQKGCFEFSCADKCDSCKLVWYDRNGDGKVQPRRELRCLNAKGNVGKVSISKVQCK